MHITQKAPSGGIAPDGLTPARSPRSGASGLGLERMTEIQRARILAAMSEVACERGAGNVTVAHVVERAGVSRRTFYELFDDREECLLAAFEEALRCAGARVLPAYRTDERWVGRIRAALAAFLEFLESEPAMGLLLVGSPGAGARALERRRGVLALAIAAVNEGHEQSKTGTEPPQLTAEGIVGGVLSILHARLLACVPSIIALTRDRGVTSSLESPAGSLLELTGPLMSMIVLPYLGAASARQELERPVPKRCASAPSVNGNPLRELRMRLTYRTVRALCAVAALPGGSNRQIADAAEITDQGQISKLLARLHSLGLIENTGAGSVRGAANAWTLTAKGWDVEAAIVRDSPPAGAQG